MSELPAAVAVIGQAQDGSLLVLDVIEAANQQLATSLALAREWHPIGEIDGEHRVIRYEQWGVPDVSLA